MENFNGASQSSEQLSEFFVRHNPNYFLQRLVTMDENWLYHYDPETKQQSTEWRHSGSLHPAQKNSLCKNPLEKFSPASIFWNQNGTLLIDHLQNGQNINAEYYSSLLV
jgi:hypothetical protein